MSARKILERCNVSRGMVCRIQKEELKDQKKIRVKKHARGTPKKLSAQEERSLIRTLKHLCHQEGNLSSTGLKWRARISMQDVSNRTVCCFLSTGNIIFLQVPKKSLLTEKDIKERLVFAERMKKNYAPEVWTDSIAFFLDGVSFCDKTNPAD